MKFVYDSLAAFLKQYNMYYYFLEFWLSTKIGVLQYVAVKPFLSAITFILSLCGVYCDGEFKYVVLKYCFKLNIALPVI